MTKQPTPDLGWLDEIFIDLLGEFHEHKCISCNGTNGGCINCRKTGHDQTPCKICDKEGIAFKNIKIAKTAIATKLQTVELEARTEQLNILKIYARAPARTVGDIIRTIDSFQHDLAELKARLTQKGDSDV